MSEQALAAFPFLSSMPRAARALGTLREVVTRILKEFLADGLPRCVIIITEECRPAPDIMEGEYGT